MSKVEAFEFGIRWGSPGMYAYDFDWWLSHDAAAGSSATFYSVTILGLELFLRLYSERFQPPRW